MRRLIELRVNGAVERVYTEPWWSLARVLREQLGLVGTKISCETGNCGACTVLIDGLAVRTCLYLAMKARGKDILTIEGLQSAEGELHPLQENFIKHFALQCGYCTPGMILAAKALLDENQSPTEVEVKEGLRGNLCRCTGYTKIIEAVLAAGDKMAGRR